MIQEKVFNNLQLFEVGQVKFQWGISSQNYKLGSFVIVFNEPKLIVLVIQGLSLATASLVFISKQKTNKGKPTPPHHPTNPNF